MKNILISYVILLLAACNNDADQQTVISDSLPGTKISAKDEKDFNHHFLILDSAQAAKPDDTLFTCCTPSIMFMEERTGISTSEDGSIVGKLSFSSKNLNEWHEWYAKRSK